MARRIKDRILDSRDARLKLKVSGKPYWRAIDRGLHVGYRKGKRGGVWVLRRYIGNQTYQLETIAQADDTSDADGVEVLDFWQAQAAVRSARMPSSRKLGGYTVTDAVRDYLESLEGKASCHDITKRLEAFVLPVFGERLAAALDADEIRRWHRDIAKTPARRRTAQGEAQAYKTDSLKDPEVLRRRQVSANRILSHLKAALNLAWREGKVPSVEAWGRVSPFKGVDIPRARYLSVPEAKRLVNAAQGDFRALVQAALQTGARYQELARLHVRDFNPDSGTLHIRKSKSAKDRHVVLTDEGQQLFGQLAAGRHGTEPMLGRAWGTNHQSAPMAEACKRAGLEPINFHALRHTWASLSVMSGLPLMMVAKNLGHVDTRMVEKHYGHLAPSYVADQIRQHAPRFGLAESNVKAMR
jgi:integrase